MSKVIHLSDEAHLKAKTYCKEHSLKMSDWVAGLIEGAIAAAVTGVHVMSSPNDDNVRALVQKKKMLEQFEEEETQSADDGLPAYAAPPFWAKGSGF